MDLRWFLPATVALVACSQSPGSSADSTSPSQTHDLHDAVRDHNYTALAELLRAAGADINTLDPDGLAPLHLAAMLGDRKATNLLLEHGADLQASGRYIISDDAGHELEGEGYTALHFAAAPAGSVEVCKALLSAGAELESSTPNGRTPLHGATAEGHVDVVRLFLRQGVNVNASFSALPVERETYRWKQRQTGTPLHLAARYGYTAIASALLANGADPNPKDDYLNTPLHVSARYGRRQIAEHLLANGADLLAWGSTTMAIHLAASGGYPTVISLFLTHFDSLTNDSDLRTQYVNVPDHLFGGTPLHYAADGGHLGAATLLIQERADVNAVSQAEGLMKSLMGEEYDEGPTGLRPLHKAAAGDRSGRVVALLLDHGAEVNAQAAKGRMALHDAAEKGNIEAVKILLEHGAEVDARWRNMTPLSVAGDHPWVASWQDNDAIREIIRLLVARGADVNVAGFQMNTQLHRAAAGRSLYIITFLLENGADPNVVNEYQQSPLSLVLSRWQESAGQLQGVARLLAQGADPDLANALHLSVSCGHDYVRLLVENGADVNRRWNGTDGTPLHLAAKWAGYKTVKYLLERGAKLDIRDEEGKTPADIAEELSRVSERHGEIATLLRALAEDGR